MRSSSESSKEVGRTLLWSKVLFLLLCVACILLSILGEWPRWLRAAMYATTLPYCLYWLSRLMKYKLSFPKETFVTPEAESDAADKVKTAFRVAATVGVLTLLVLIFPQAREELLAGFFDSVLGFQFKLGAISDVLVWLALSAANLAAVLFTWKAITVKDSLVLPSLKVVPTLGGGEEDELLDSIDNPEALAWVLSFMCMIFSYMALIESMAPAWD